jgi:hypothetical protein
MTLSKSFWKLLFHPTSDIYDFIDDFDLLINLSMMMMIFGTRQEFFLGYSGW